MDGQKYFTHSDDRTSCIRSELVPQHQGHISCESQIPRVSIVHTFLCSARLISLKNLQYELATQRRSRSNGESGQAGSTLPTTEHGCGGS
jgi:hypothetical protein